MIFMLIPVPEVVILIASRATGHENFVNKAASIFQIFQQRNVHWSLHNPDRISIANLDPITYLFDILFTIQTICKKHFAIIDHQIITKFCKCLDCKHLLDVSNNYFIWIQMILIILYHESISINLIHTMLRSWLQKGILCKIVFVSISNYYTLSKQKQFVLLANWYILGNQVSEHMTYDKGIGKSLP